MAGCIFTHAEDWDVTVPATKSVDGVVFYIVRVRVGTVVWRVPRRFREFARLHEILSSEHSIPKDALPPKRLNLWNGRGIVESRRLALETYLNTALRLLIRTLPLQLAVFLHFDKYEVIFILKDMIAALSVDPHRITPTYEMDILQVHAISERLKLPCPPADMVGLQHDLCSILDFCSHITTLTIVGKEYYENASIEPETLKFEFVPFKALTHLTLKEVNPTAVVKAEELRQNLKGFSVLNCRLKSLEQILLCDCIHKEIKLLQATKSWDNVLEADFSYNKLTVIDESVSLLPSVKTLNLSSNVIKTATALSSLAHLENLNLSNNRIAQIKNLNLTLETLSHLDISQNAISSLSGLECLPNLISCDISSNKICDINEIDHINNLPKLENISLTGNPLSTIVDYRIKVIEKFNCRASQIILDNEQSSQQELDTVAVLQTLRFVREGKSPDIKIKQNVSSPCQ